MSSIPSITNAYAADRPAVIGRIGPKGIDTTVPGSAGGRGDSVEFSSEALAHVNDSPETQARTARLAAIKSQIDAGTYDTEDKASIVAHKLAKLWGGNG